MIEIKYIPNLFLNEVNLGVLTLNNKHSLIINVWLKLKILSKCNIKFVFSTIYMYINIFVVTHSAEYEKIGTAKSKISLTLLKNHSETLINHVNILTKSNKSSYSFVVAL